METKNGNMVTLDEMIWLVLLLFWISALIKYSCGFVFGNINFVIGA